MPGTLGFDFAFGINEQLDPRYGKYRVIQKDEYYSDELDKNGRRIRKTLERELSFATCGTESYLYPDLD